MTHFLYTPFARAREASLQKARQEASAVRMPPSRKERSQIVPNGLSVLAWIPRAALRSPGTGKRQPETAGTEETALSLPILGTRDRTWASYAYDLCLGTRWPSPPPWHCPRA